MNIPVKTALISTWNKKGLVDLAQVLTAHGVRIYSTGGTLTHLRDAGMACTSISRLTGFPEILNGRVKTLHPAVFAGLLARRNAADHLNTLSEWGFPLFDLVVVNLYPFEESLAGPRDQAPDEMVELIDIGGVALVRAAAKNFAWTAVCTSPEDYPGIIDELNAQNGALTFETRLRLARQAFARTSRYDQQIASYFQQLNAETAATAFPTASPVDHSRRDSSDSAPEGSAFPVYFTPIYRKIQDLRYGENSHQKAAYYEEWAPEGAAAADCGLTGARQLQGKELSYNNIMDADTALEVVREFEEPCCVILKHSNPCGLAIADTIQNAYERARQTDPTSAFGGIIGLNRPVDGALASIIAETFNEVVVAPGYSPEALQVLARKKNLRLLEIPEWPPKRPSWQPRAVVGGILLQDRDIGIWNDRDLRVVTRNQPTPDDWRGLAFAWKCVKWVKSNAIVITSQTETIGIGAGQMSRVDAVNLAIQKSLRPTQGAFLASDAFFPFPDSVETAAGAGIRAIIQPGGSVRDEEVISAADQAGLIMVFTGMRHFRH
ncbi:MAG: bifunctional phosphoribosylaminoimidazolecarboxamide formyltransferase/IMP cyclohydrolase [Candidatus Sumerlaeia bacterium]